MTIGEWYWIVLFFLIVGLKALDWGLDQTLQRRVVSRETAVVVRRTRVQTKIVALDRPKIDAVEALVRDGWRRKAAVSALASINWRGYPDVAAMVLSAWKSMPGYRA